MTVHFFDHNIVQFDESAGWKTIEQILWFQRSMKKEPQNKCNKLLIMN